MSTPTKRRKTNTYKSSPKTVGSLDFFFGKQTDSQGAKSRDNDTKSEADDQSSTLGALSGGIGLQNLTDEELARKLQDEWDEQDKRQGSREGDPTTDATEALFQNSTFLNSDTRTTPVPVHFNGHQNTDQSPQIREYPSHGKKDILALQSTVSAENSISSTVPFDENPLTFDPSKYLPELRKHWTELGNNASYAILTRCFILVNSTQSRIKIVDTLVNFLRTLIEGDPDSLLPAVITPTCQVQALLRLHRSGWRPTLYRPLIFHWSWALEAQPYQKR